MPSPSNGEPQQNRLNHGSGKNDHIVHFYTDDAALIGEWADYIGTALSSGSSAIVVATRAHIDGLAARLVTYGVDLQGAIDEDRYIARDAAETLSHFCEDGKLDAARLGMVGSEIISRATRASHQEDRCVVVFGEMVALLWADGYGPAAIELEKVWNTLQASHSFTLRCCYRARDFWHFDHQQPFLDICAQHSMVVLDTAQGPFSSGLPS
jgi:hypothetical protein